MWANLPGAPSAREPEGASPGPFGAHLPNASISTFPWMPAPPTSTVPTCASRIQPAIDLKAVKAPRLATVQSVPIRASQEIQPDEVIE